MNKADGQDTADRLSAIVANSLDTQAKTQDLARQAYQSRTQFHRLFRTVVEETPAAMRRRLLLERAYQLVHKLKRNFNHCFVYHWSLRKHVKTVSDGEENSSETHPNNRFISPGP